MGDDPQQKRKVKECKDDFCILVCATSNVLTLRPAEERPNTSLLKLDSHRRLDLASQFTAAGIPIIGLQDTRLGVARATGIGQYLIFATTTHGKGQDGMELWIRSSWAPSPHDALLMFASNWLLIVRVPMLVGVVQFVVAHALDTSYPTETVKEWWAAFRSTFQSILVPSLLAIWLIDAKATLGSSQSDAIGPHHPETESIASGFVHALLLDWKMALPATFHNDEAGAATWQSTTLALDKRIDFVAIPRSALTTCSVSRGCSK